MSEQAQHYNASTLLSALILLPECMRTTLTALWSLPWPLKWPSYLMLRNAANLITPLFYPLIPQQTLDHRRLKRISQYSQRFTYVSHASLTDGDTLRTDTNLDSTAYYIPSLYDIGFCS